METKMETKIKTEKQETIHHSESPLSTHPKTFIEASDITQIRKSMEISKSLEEVEYQSPRERSRPFTIDDANSIIDLILNNKVRGYGNYALLTNKILTIEQMSEINSGIVSSESESLYINIHNLAKEFFEKYEADDFICKAADEFDEESSWIYTRLPITKKSDMRLYLKPILDETFNVWNDLMAKLKENEEIKRFGFSSKIANINAEHLDKFLMCCNQDDRMLFYFPKEIENIAIKIVQKYISDNKHKFENSFSLATPLLDKEGNKLNCAFAAEELMDLPERMSTLNSLYGKMISKLLQNFLIKERRENDLDYNDDYYVFYSMLLSDNKLKRKLAKYMVTELPRLTQQYGFKEESTSFRKNYPPNVNLN
jgi:hypothetical protein